MSKRLSCFCSAFLLVMGCSTDSPQTASDAGGSGGAANGAGGGGSGAAGAASATGGAAGATGGAAGAAGATGGSAGTHAGGSASLGDASNASPECVTFCTCMAANCPDKVFSGGCLPECAAGTSWDLPCRQNMCKLVPDQPNNDHCTHAFGTSECN